jgi:gluconolactonase
MPLDIDVMDERFSQVVEPGAGLEELASGFYFTEGPVWHPKKKLLYFSDIPADQLYTWSESGGVNPFRCPSQKANGNTLDKKGRLLTCEHSTSRVTRTGDNGRVEVLASHYQGKELNSPNDVVVGSDHSIYFTDPPYGRTPVVGLERPRQLDFQGVYRINGQTGELTLLADDFALPNGLCLSLDESRLFVDDSYFGWIRVFDLKDDGGLEGGEEFAKLIDAGYGVADGMKLDSRGWLYCCGPGGVQVFDGKGAMLGIIRMPEVVANLAWGDEDLKTMYLTASSGLYRLRTQAPGLAVL